MEITRTKQNGACPSQNLAFPFEHLIRPFTVLSAMCGVVQSPCSNTCCKNEQQRGGVFEERKSQRRLLFTRSCAFFIMDQRRFFRGIRLFFNQLRIRPPVIIYLEQQNCIADRILPLFKIRSTCLENVANNSRMQRALSLSVTSELRVHQPNCRDLQAAKLQQMKR